MSLAIVYSRASMGVQAPLVTIEVHLSNGKPGFTLVGLPEKTVKEAQDRVRSALMNAQFKYPAKRITVNLAPADLPKEGGRFDLPIAIGILAASDQLDGSRLKQFEFVGELALTGELRGVHGVIPAILAAQKAKRAPIIAYQNANEASLVSEQETYFAKNLLEVVQFLNNQEKLPLASLLAQESAVGFSAKNHLDLTDIIGQQHAKRALTIAAAGQHNLLFLGPPGTGKTMLAERLPSILPTLDNDAAMEVLAHRLEEWGLLPVSAEVSLTVEGGQHRRWMPHGTSHHLGLDVHDCAQAKAELYTGATLEPGMVFTIEPALYFKDEDLSVPEEYRGIGIRLEDDVLCTEDGNVNLSAALPRTVEEIEAWMAKLAQ